VVMVGQKTNHRGKRSKNSAPGTGPLGEGSKKKGGEGVAVITGIGKGNTGREGVKGWLNKNKERGGGKTPIGGLSNSKCFEHQGRFKTNTPSLPTERFGTKGEMKRRALSHC